MRIYVYVQSGNKQKHEAGVGFLLSKRARVMTGLWLQNSRHGRLNVCLSGVCSHVRRYKQTGETIYADLETTLNDIPKKDIVIITGNWNAKVGNDNNG